MNKQKQTIRKRLQQATSQVDIPAAQTILSKAAGREVPTDSVPQPETGRKGKIFSLSAAALACAAAVCALLLLPMKEDAPPVQTAPVQEDLPIVEETELPQDPQPVPPEEETSWYISFDVNPGIELTVGEDGRVALARGVNEEGRTLLSALALEGKSAEEATAAIVDALVEAGYIDPAQRTNTMLIGGLKNDDLLTRVTQAATAELGEKEARTFVIEQKITDEAAAREVADKYGVTLGKAQYILDLSRQEGDQDIQNLATADITYIFSAWNRVMDTLEAGEYDEYGQQVLYPIPQNLEVMNAALVWERFSEEQRAALREQYTQEELDILYAPTVQAFTVPDFKGMTASQCKALAKERGFVVRVAYSDVAIPGDWFDWDSLPKGKCYYQDPEPGWRTVTTTEPVTVFIHRADPTRYFHTYMWMSEAEVRSAIAGWHGYDIIDKYRYKDFNAEDPNGVIHKEGHAYDLEFSSVTKNNSITYTVIFYIQRTPEGVEPPAQPTPTPDPTPQPVITDGPVPDCTPEPLPDDPEEPTPEPAPVPDPTPAPTPAPAPEPEPETAVEEMEL